METLPLYQLEERYQLLKSLANAQRIYYDFEYQFGYTKLAANAKNSLIDTLNEIGWLASQISTMKLKGETDAITTDFALDYLGCDYTKTNSLFYINS